MQSANNASMPEKSHKLQTKEQTAKLLQEYANQTNQQIYLRFDDLKEGTQVMLKWINHKGERLITTKVDLDKYKSYNTNELAKTLTQQLVDTIQADNRV